MRWFRSHIRLGSRLALFALAVQIVLSFGHVHVSGLAGATDQAAAVVAGGLNADAPAKSPAQKPGTPVDQTCPICALIQLASAATPTAAPAVLPPAMLGEVRLNAPDQAVLATAPLHHFRARAPPIA